MYSQEVKQPNALVKLLQLLVVVKVLLLQDHHLDHHLDLQDHLHPHLAAALISSVSAQCMPLTDGVTLEGSTISQLENNAASHAMEAEGLLVEHQVHPLEAAHAEIKSATAECLLV